MKHIPRLLFLFFLLQGLPCMARDMEPPDTSYKGPLLIRTTQETGHPTAGSEREEKEYRTGQILVKFREGTAVKTMEAVQQEFCLKILKIVVRPYLCLMKITDGSSIEQVLARLEDVREIEYAEPNHYYGPSFIPDDTHFDLQWALHNTGREINGRAGTRDADMDVPEAWDISTGRVDVIVAVIDSGVDYNHPDLSSSIWINNMEVANNSLDDDGNGFIDDILGWDFVDDDNDPMDTYSHGTHSAGIIAAEADNQRGVAGISSHARIMILRIINASGVATTADAVAAVNYASENGADVINISWGVRDPIYPSRALQEAIEASEAVVVCAAGNQGSDNDATPYYPASYEIDHIIAVASSDQDDGLSSFSNFGAGSVDVAAPGENIVSCRLSSSYDEGAYQFGSGTSASAACVSGLASLIKSQSPYLSNREIKAAIENSVDIVPSFSEMISTSGRINGYNVMVNVSGISAAGRESDGAGGGGGGGCFIATAAFGSPMENQVKVLCRFRDRYLMTNRPGRAFIKIYYALSPSLAGMISRSHTARFLVRWSLLPVVAFCRLSVHFGPAVFFLSFLFMILLISCVFIRRKKPPCHVQVRDDV